MKKVLSAAILLSLILSGCYLISDQSLTSTPLSTSTLVEHPATTQTSIPVLTSTSSYTVTATLAPTAVPTRTVTLTPTRTLTPTKTSTPIKTFTPTQTSTPLPFVLQAEAPVYIKNFVHTDESCNWSGVAGQVFGEDGSPQLNLVLVVIGRLGQKTINLAGVTGIPEADIYGPGGYEIQLADAATASSQGLTIQVFDLEGNALSEAYPFDTYADCDKNLAVINFKAQ